MHIYLPIAEMPVHVLAIILLGGAAGVLAGMFGVGGGFLMTPLLMFIGIPPPVAVASATNQIIAASVSGFLTQWRKQNVDFRMGMVLLAGGWVGSSLGVTLFAWLQTLGQIDLAISVCYVVFLGSIGTMMGLESWRALRGQKPRGSVLSALPSWLHRLPLRMEFPRSGLEVSALLPLGIGLGVGVLISLMGIGGGLIMIPAMIYVLGMPTSVVVGTSLFQIIFISANVTLLHALNTQTVDVVLALLLVVGSVFGAQVGTRISTLLPGEILRGLLALMVLAIALRLAWGLFITPGDPFSVEYRPLTTDSAVMP